MYETSWLTNLSTSENAFSQFKVYEKAEKQNLTKVSRRRDFCLLFSISTHDRTRMRFQPLIRTTAEHSPVEASIWNVKSLFWSEKNWLLTFTKRSGVLQVHTAIRMHFNEAIWYPHLTLSSESVLHTCRVYMYCTIQVHKFALYLYCIWLIYVTTKICTYMDTDFL